MTSAAINAQLLSQDVVAKPASLSAAQDITTAIEMMQRLTLDLLDLCVSDQAELAVNLQPIAVAPVLSAALLPMRSLASAKDQDVILRLPTTPTGEVDSYLLTRIVQNLVGNSLRYSPTATTVQVTLEETESHLRILVDDQGAGVPDGIKEQVFDPYARIDYAQERTGHGLGLAFCKLAVEAQGGQIWLEDGSEGGCRCVVELNRAKPAS
jgi:signal transduction histidine kinase